MPVSCAVCGEQDFTGIDGLYFCKICATQSLDFRDEEDDQFRDPTFVTQGKRVKSTTKEHQPREDTNALSQSRLYSSFEVLQIILKEQVREILNLGASARYEGAVHKLWCIYLSKIGEAYIEKPTYKLKATKVSQRDIMRPTFAAPGAASKRKTNTVQEHSDSDEELAPVYEVDCAQHHGVKMSTVNPSLPTLLGILQLGLSLTSPLHGPSDIIRWIRSGKLSYFNADRIVPSDMKSANTDHQLFSQLVLPTHHSIRVTTANLARFIGLESTDFPPVNILNLCSKYIVDLNLPGELVGIVQSLSHIKAPQPTFEPFSSKIKHRMLPEYEAIAMSLIIISLRHLYSFHNHTDSLLSSYAANIQNLINQLDGPPVFICDLWILTMLNNRFTCQFDLPRDASDVKRLASVEKPLQNLSFVTAPPRRFVLGGKKSTIINKPWLRDEMVKPLKQVAEKLHTENRSRELDDQRDEQLTNRKEEQILDETIQWSQPMMTSSQPEDVLLPEEPDLTEQTCSYGHEVYRNHTLKFLTHPKEFLVQTNLLTESETMDNSTFFSFIEKNSPEGCAHEVVSALLSEGNFVKPVESQGTYASLLQICSDRIGYEVDDLTPVLTVIETAYINCVNHLKPMRFGQEDLYFRPVVIERTRKFINEAELVH